MPVRMKVLCSLVVGVAAWVGAVAGVACSDSSSSFQPLAYGARPWAPPAGWDPEPPCAPGYYVAINTCEGCAGISYALCSGTRFTQCVCGGPFWTGAVCPQTFACSSDDFPPTNWVEFTDYAGPGWAGLQSQAVTGDGG
jgi:hypothetical protein